MMNSIDNLLADSASGATNVSMSDLGTLISSMNLITVEKNVNIQADIELNGANVFTTADPEAPEVSAADNTAAIADV